MPIKSIEKRKLYQKERYHRLKKEREAEEKKDPWVNEVYPGLEPESETEASDFEHITPQEYDSGVGRIFDVIQDPEEVPEDKIREPPRTEPINEFLRPPHLQDLSPEALEEITRGISPLLYDRMEKVEIKDDKPEKRTTWGRIIGDS